jgi:hypothetical protein
MRAKGVAELRREMQTLRTEHPTPPHTEASVLQQQHEDYHKHNAMPLIPWMSLDEGGCERPADPPPRPITQRKSLPSPAHFDFSPHRVLSLKRHLHHRHLPPGAAVVAAAATGGAEQPTDPSKPLSQQLLQHKLQQKRQIFQKQFGPVAVSSSSSVCGAPCGGVSASAPLHQQFQQMQLEAGVATEHDDIAQLPQDLTAALHQAALHHQQHQQHQQQLAMMRRHVIRQTSYKLAQQQTVMPPLGPSDPAGATGDMIPPWQLMGPVDPPPLSPMFEEGEGEGNGDMGGHLGADQATGGMEVA